MKVLLLLLTLSGLLGAQSLIVINTESDLPATVDADYAVTGDYSARWKAEAGAWVKQAIVQEAQEEITDDEGNVTQSASPAILNWTGSIWFFDYRFETGETPLYSGGKLTADNEGAVKKVYAHKAGHSDTWVVQFIGF